MAKSLYIAGVEPRSGKSVVALGVMELLSRRVRKVGYFRPVVLSRKMPDNNLQLIQKRYDLNFSYEELYACAHKDALAMVSANGSNDVLLKHILEKFKILEDRCNFVLCEGTDFTGISTSFEFDFNAEVAANLGCPILALINGRGKTLEEIAEATLLAKDAFEGKGCTLAATIVNRVAPEQRDAVAKQIKDAGTTGAPLYVLPEVPSLGRPTIGDIADALQAQVLQGMGDEMYRSIHEFKVAAMKLPNFLDYINDGDLVITPGDRADIIVGSLAASASHTYPKIAGLLLTGGLSPDPQIKRLLEGFPQSSRVPILQVPIDTYTTAVHAGEVRSRLTPGNERKIAAALGVFEAHVNTSQLEKRIELVRSIRRTPLMFEYELIERAKADSQRIVLP